MATKNDSDNAAKRRQRFIDELAEEADGDSATRSGKHCAAFLAIRDLVELGLESGYPMKQVWKRLSTRGEISMAYSTFRTHCKRAGLWDAAPAAIASPEGLPGTVEADSSPGQRPVVDNLGPDDDLIFY